MIKSPKEWWGTVAAITVLSFGTGWLVYGILWVVYA